MIQTIPTPPTPPLPPEVVVTTGGVPESVVAAVTVIVALVVAGVILLPLVRAWARKIEGRTTDAGLLNEVGQLRARVAELEDLHNRVGELEERVDFSERLLSQGAAQPVERKGGNG